MQGNPIPLEESFLSQKELFRGKSQWAPSSPRLAVRTRAAGSLLPTYSGHKQSTSNSWLCKWEKCTLEPPLYIGLKCEHCLHYQPSRNSLRNKTVCFLCARTVLERRKVLLPSYPRIPQVLMVWGRRHACKQTCIISRGLFRYRSIAIK